MIEATFVPPQIKPGRRPPAPGQRFHHRLRFAPGPTGATAAEPEARASLERMRMDTSTATGRLHPGRAARAGACCRRASSGAAADPRPPPLPPPPTASTAPASTAPAATAAPTTSAKRGSPRWETVTTLTGTGSAEPPAFPILADSIQWRVRWECQVGRLRITTAPSPRRGPAMADGACPGRCAPVRVAYGAAALVP